MTTTQTRQIEFIAALSIPDDFAAELQEVAEGLAEAVREAVRLTPQVTEYLAQAVEDLGEIHIGFRFEGVDPDDVEEWAEDLLADTIENFKKRPGLGRVKDVRREDSSLQIA